MDALLEAQRSACQDKIQAAQSRIAYLTELINSITAFESEVVASKDRFETANSKKTALLSDLTRYTSETSCIEEFKEGMSNTLSGIGMKIVGLTFAKLKLSVAAKKAGYVTERKLQEAALNGLLVEQLSIENAISLEEAI